MARSAALAVILFISCGGEPPEQAPPLGDGCQAGVYCGWWYTDGWDEYYLLALAPDGSATWTTDLVGGEATARGTWWALEGWVVVHLADATGADASSQHYLAQVKGADELEWRTAPIRQEEVTARGWMVITQEAEAARLPDWYYVEAGQLRLARITVRRCKPDDRSLCCPSQRTWGRRR